MTETGESAAFRSYPPTLFFFLAMAEPFLNLLLSLCSSFSPSRLGSGVNSKWGPTTKQASGGILLHLTLGRKKSVKPQKPQKKSVSVFFSLFFLPLRRMAMKKKVAGIVQADVVTTLLRGHPEYGLSPLFSPIPSLSRFVVLLLIWSTVRLKIGKRKRVGGGVGSLRLVFELMAQKAMVCCGHPSCYSGTPTRSLAAAPLSPPCSGLSPRFMMPQHLDLKTKWRRVNLIRFDVCFSPACPAAGY